MSFMRNLKAIKEEKVTLYDETRLTNRYFPFRQCASWFAFTETEIALYHHDALVKNFTLFNDFYGFLTSIEIEDEVQAALDHYKIGPNDTLEVRATVSLNLTLEAKNERGETTPISMTGFTPFISEGERYFRKIDIKTMVDQKILYSSLNAPSENAKLLEKVKSEFSDRERLKDRIKALKAEYFLDEDCA